MNKKQEIIRIFSDLSSFLKYKYSLMESLSLIEKSCTRGKDLRKAVSKIKKNLESGFDFYGALELAGFEKQIEEYKNVLTSQENNSQLQKNLEYIVFSDTQKNQVKKNLFSISLYPIFIVVFSLVLSVLLLKNKDSFFTLNQEFGFGTENKNLQLEVGIIKAFGFLLFYSLGFFSWICFLISEPFSKRFLISLHFLINQNYSVFEATQLMLLREKSRKRIFILSTIIKKMKEGEEFFLILKNIKGIGKTQLDILEKTRWTKNYLEVFQDYYNFEKSKETKRIENIQKYSESFLIFGVGLYLLILLKNTVLPFLTF